MTTHEAQQIERQRESLADIHPTREIAGVLRASRARMRHLNARGVREPAPRDYVADFAKLFGEPL